MRLTRRSRVDRKSQVHLQTPASTSLRANFSNVFAPKSLASLMDLDMTLEVPTDKTVIKRLEDAGPRWVPQGCPTLYEQATQS